MGPQPWIVAVAAGLVLIAVGVVVSMTPITIPGEPGGPGQEPGEPRVVGTLWTVGLPIVVGGVVVLVWGLHRRAAPPVGEG